MSSIASYRATYGDTKDLVCSFCGKAIPARMGQTSGGGGGYWNGVGAKFIFCCHKCATGNLPRLMADSILLDVSNAQMNSRNAWKEAEISYLASITSRMASLLRRIQRGEGDV